MAHKMSDIIEDCIPHPKQKFDRLDRTSTVIKCLETLIHVFDRAAQFLNSELLVEAVERAAQFFYVMNTSGYRCKAEFRHQLARSMLRCMHIRFKLQSMETMYGYTVDLMVITHMNEFPELHDDFHDFYQLLKDKFTRRPWDDDEIEVAQSDDDEAKRADIIALRARREGSSGSDNTTTCSVSPPKEARPVVRGLDGMDLHIATPVSTSDNKASFAGSQKKVNADQKKKTQKSDAEAEKDAVIRKLLGLPTDENEKTETKHGAEASKPAGGDEKTEEPSAKSGGLGMGWKFSSIFSSGSKSS